MLSERAEISMNIDQQLYKYQPRSAASLSQRDLPDLWRSIELQIEFSTDLGGGTAISGTRLNRLGARFRGGGAGKFGSSINFEDSATSVTIGLKGKPRLCIRLYHAPELTRSCALSRFDSFFGAACSPHARVEAGNCFYALSFAYQAAAAHHTRLSHPERSRLFQIIEAGFLKAGDEMIAGSIPLEQVRLNFVAATEWIGTVTPALLEERKK